MVEQKHHSRTKGQNWGRAVVKKWYYILYWPKNKYYIGQNELGLILMLDWGKHVTQVQKYSGNHGESI